MDIQFLSASLANNATDISNFSYYYKIGQVQFESPALIVLQDYYSYLRANSTIQIMNKRYYMRPDYASYDFYNTTNLAFVILYVNNCMSAMDFTMPEFVLPDEEAVMYVVGQQLINYARPQPEELEY